MKEEKLPSWKKLSGLAQVSEAKETMEVRMERSYHLKDEDDTEVEKENVAQGREMENSGNLTGASLKNSFCPQLRVHILALIEPHPRHPSND